MSYTKQTWKAGDEVTSAKLNHIEDGINSVAGEVAELTEAVENSSGDENPFAWTEKLTEEDLEYPDFSCTCTERYNSEPNEDGTYSFFSFGGTFGLSKTLFVKYKYSNEEWINNETEREILTSDYTLTGIYIKSENAIVYGAKQIEDSEGNYSYTFDDNMPFMIKIIKFPRQDGNGGQVIYTWKGKYTQSFECYYINSRIEEIKPEFSNAIDNYYNSTLKNMIIKNTFGLRDIDQHTNAKSKLTRTEILNKDNIYIGIYTGTLHLISDSYGEIISIIGTNDPYWENTYSFYPIQKVILDNLRYNDNLSYTFYMGASKLIITKLANNLPQLILNVRLELVQDYNSFSEQYEIQMHQVEQFNFSNSLIELLSSADFNKILCGYYHNPVTKIREYELEKSSYNFSSETIDGYPYTVLTYNFPFSAISSFRNNMYIQINYQSHNNPSIYKLNLNGYPSKYSTYFNINSGPSANIILKTDTSSSICTLTIKALSQYVPYFNLNGIASISLAQMDEASFDSIRKPFQDAIKFVLNQENITSNVPLIVNQQSNNSWKLDKTYTEVKEAFLAGRKIIVIHDAGRLYSQVVQLHQDSDYKIILNNNQYYYANNETDYLTLPD